MAKKTKKKVVVKEVIPKVSPSNSELAIRIACLDTRQKAFAKTLNENMSIRIDVLELRIDKLVTALSKAKSVKGI